MDDELTELRDELSKLKSELGRNHLSSLHSPGVPAYDGMTKFLSSKLLSTNHRTAESS